MRVSMACCRMWGVLLTLLLLYDCVQSAASRLGRSSFDCVTGNIDESEVGQSSAESHHRRYNSVYLGRRLLSTTNRRRRIENRSGIDILAIRGGSSEIESSDSTVMPKDCNVIIQSTLGSSFLDKKKRLTIPSNSTILELKEQLAHKFPGSPPVSLQRLFYGFKYLKDDDIVGNVSSVSPIPILLDMISGTSVYNKSMSISQTLEAYASLIVHQTYLHDKLKEQFTSQAAAVDESMQTVLYREMFESINQTLHETYREDIAVALELEKDPEALSSDTIAWRAVNSPDRNPLTEAFAKEFDLNFRGIKHFLYYSVLLVVFAYFGTNTSVSSKFLLLMVPFLWVSKVRQLRIAFKLVSYVLLPFMPSMGFVMPLLPAPLQVIAIELSKIAPASEDEVPRGDDDDNDEDVDESSDDNGDEGLDEDPADEMADDEDDEDYTSDAEQEDDEVDDDEQEDD